MRDTVDSDLLETIVSTTGLDDHMPLLFEGSLAEGFGNSTSDVDLLALTPEGDQRLAMPIIRFAGKKRVEVRLRSESQVRAIADTIRTATDMWALEEHVLDEWHRFRHGQMLRGADTIESLRTLLTDEAFENVVHLWHRTRAESAITRAFLLDMLGATDAALDVARAALLHGAKAWLASRHQTYLEEKWLEEQLRRVGSSRETIERLRDSLFAPPSLADVEQLLERFQIRAARVEDYLVRIPGKTTTWQIDAHVHVANESALYRLDARTSKVWQRLRTGSSLRGILSSGERETILSLFRARLIAFSPPASDPSRAISSESEIGVARSSRVLLTGASAGAPIVSPCGNDAKDFAAAGMALIWENVLIENAVEDATGALTAGQVFVVCISIDRIITAASRCLLSTFGVTPLPSRSESVSALNAGFTAHSDTQEFLARQQLIRRALASRDLDRAWSSCLELIAWTRQMTGGESFPSSFESLRAWQHTVSVGYDWIRLGAYVEASFPAREAQEVLSLRST